MTRSRWTAPLLLALLTLGYFADALVQAPQRFLAGYDVARAHYWHKKYIAARLLAHELPLWNPYSYAGHPFLAYPETCVFYPPSLLFVALPVSTAFTVNVVLHVYLAALGSFLFLRLLTGRRLAGLVAAVAYGFGGYMLERIGIGHLSYYQSAAWLPWVALFLERGLRRGAWPEYARAGLAFGLLILASPPHHAWYAGLFVLVYSALRLVTGRDVAAGGVGRVLGPASIVVVGAALAAIQILPTLELAAESDRSQPSFDFSTFISFPPAALSLFVVPHLESSMITESRWELTGYVGILGLLLAIVGALDRDRRGLSVPLLGVAVFSLTLMLGGHTPLYRLYYDWLPGVRLFRVPARAVLLFTFSLACLAGLGTARLFSAARERELRSALVGAWLALLLGLLAIRTVSAPGPWPAAVVPAFALLLVSGAVLVAGWRWPTAAIPRAAVVAVLLADVTLAFHGALRYADTARLETPTAAERLILEERALARVARPEGTNRGLGLGYFEVNAYEPLVIGRYFKLVHALAGVEADPLKRHTLSPRIFEEPHDLLWKLLNVQYVVTDKGGLRVDPLPRAFLVFDARFEPDLERQLQQLREGGIDPAKTVLVDRPPPERNGADDLVEDMTAEARVVRYEPERIDLETTSARAATLVLSELYFPGWTAAVDGAPVEILRADYVLRAVPVPRGHHRVTFEYRPRSLRRGALVSIPAWAALLGALSWSRGTARERRSRT